MDEILYPTVLYLEPGKWTQEETVANGSAPEQKYYFHGIFVTIMSPEFGKFRYISGKSWPVACCTHAACLPHS